MMMDAPATNDKHVVAYASRRHLEAIVISAGDVSPKEADVYGVRSDYCVPHATTRGGKRVCRWCYGALPIGRSSWCSRECAQEHKRRFNWPECKKQILRRDGKKCCICGARDIDRQLEVDHIQPVFLGGDNRPSNLRTLCVTCHKEVTRQQRKK